MKNLGITVGQRVKIIADGFDMKHVNGKQGIVEMVFQGRDWQGEIIPMYAVRTEDGRGYRLSCWEVAA